jgi:hypothetical protein
MADNFEVGPASGGTVFASDEVTPGVQTPRSKIGIGEDGSYVDASRSEPIPTALRPKDPKRTHVFSAALAAGSSITLSSDQITAAKTGKLIDVWAQSTVILKAELYTVENDVASAVLATWFPSPWLYSPVLPSLEYITQAQVGPGFDGFRVQITNLDPEITADVYSTFWYDEVD